LNFDKSLVIFTVKEVPGLLGGFRLNFVTDSKVIDFSIAGKIKRLAAVLNY
jgi:F0F1-type ATP synthase delta subunit